MKKKGLLGVAAVILALALLSSAGSLEAATTVIDQWQVGCVIDEGVGWVDDDGVFHGRGRTEAIVNYSYDDELEAAVVVGSGTAPGHIDLDLATGNANLWGVFSMIYLPLSNEGTFDGVWNAGLLGWNWVPGESTGDGTGPLRGSKLRLSLEEEPVPAWLEEELELRPPPCGRDNAAIYHNVGTVRGRHPR